MPIKLGTQKTARRWRQHCGSMARQWQWWWCKRGVGSIAEAEGMRMPESRDVCGRTTGGQPQSTRAT